MTTPAAGWYSDPGGSGGLRWWDGQQWTDHLRPAAPATPPADAATAATSHAAASVTPEPAGAGSGPSPAAQGPARTEGAPSAPRRRRKKVGLIVGIASVAVVALVATVAVVMVRGLGAPSSALPTQATKAEGRAVAVTAPLTGLDRDEPLTFPASYDFDAETRTRGSDATDVGWAFEVFLDPTLTKRGDLIVGQSRPGEDLRIWPSESRELRRVDDETVSVDVMSDDADHGTWGLEPEYYLVRHVDEHGEPLETPVVTKFSAAPSPIAAPRVRVDSEDATGDLQLSWSSVPGATEYIVVGSHEQTSSDDGTGFRQYEVLGTTDELTWSSAELEQLGRASRQNSYLELFDGQSADSILGLGDLSTLSFVHSGYRWGVIASNGTDRSSIGDADANSLMETLPYETATFSMGQSIFRPEELPTLTTRFAFTSLDGQIRETQAVIPEGGVVPAQHVPGAIDVHIQGMGTKLDWTATLVTPDPSFDAEAFRADYNARAAAAAPATGGAAPIVKTLEQVKEDVKPKTEPAAVDYPVYGSDEFVRFLAGHLINGTADIDVTEYANAPGAQTVADAFFEAETQNPYALDVRSYSYDTRWKGDKSVVHVEYSMKSAERERLQQLTKSWVEQTVAAVAPEGMSPRDKAIALNDFLAANTEYDRAALEASDDERDIIYSYAWRVDGVIEHGAVVCGGYATAYSALMNAAGVPTVYVSGTVLSGGRHAWNKVQVDGAWYAVDTTWNDSADPNRYLLIPDSGFTGDAQRTEDAYWIRDDLQSAYRTP